jgi:SAM-dependent methyltransferase
MGVSKCPICSDRDIAIVGSQCDDRYAYPGQFAVFRCSYCDHAFLDCNFTSCQLSDLYTNYYPRKNFDISQYKPHREASGPTAWFNGLKSSAFRSVPEKVRVLDVGCGFGQSLGYHAARGCDVYGVEADENIRRVSDQFGFKVHVGLFDGSLYEAGFFDYITMDQVIEHVTDPLSTLRGVARVLKPGGTAIFSTPNSGGWGAKLFGQRWINWHAPYHVQFFSRNSIRLAAEQAGLAVEQINTITNSEWLYYQWIHLATYPKPGVPSSFWSPSDPTRPIVQSPILRTLAVMHRYKINHLLTRFFDSLCLGDNFVFVLKKP